MTEYTHNKMERGIVRCRAEDITTALPPMRFLSKEEELSEMTIVQMNWDDEAVNIFLTKWDNTEVETPFARPQNSMSFKRSLLEHLCGPIEGAMVVNEISVQVNTPALFMLALSLSELCRKGWVTTILNEQPHGWTHKLARIGIPFGGKYVSTPMLESRLFC